MNEHCENCKWCTWDDYLSSEYVDQIHKGNAVQYPFKQRCSCRVSDPKPYVYDLVMNSDCKQDDKIKGTEFTYDNSFMKIIRNYPLISPHDLCCGKFEQREKTESEEKEELLNKSFRHLKTLNRPYMRVGSQLEDHGIRTIIDLLKYSEKDLCQKVNLGTYSITTIKKALAQVNLKLKAN